MTAHTLPRKTFPFVKKFYTFAVNDKGLSPKSLFSGLEEATLVVKTNMYSKNNESIYLYRQRPV